MECQEMEGAFGAAQPASILVEVEALRRGEACLVSFRESWRARTEPTWPDPLPPPLPHGLSHVKEPHSPPGTGPEQSLFALL